MIKIHDISFGYNRSRPLFTDLKLSLPSGQIYGLLGKNGEGKSTLLYLIAALLSPSKGKILVDDIPVLRRSAAQLSDLFLCPESLSLPSVTIHAFARHNAHFYPKFSPTDMERYLNIFGLHLSDGLHELSMGDRKKAYMSFALATNTRYLLMDEPSNGLDIPSKIQFRKALLMGMHEDKTIIISTHQVRDVDSLLDHILMLDDGRLVLNHSVPALSESLYFEEVSLDQSNAPHVLYAQPSARGSYIVRKPLSGESSMINLEVLFNAMITDTSRIHQALSDI